MSQFKKILFLDIDGVLNSFDSYNSFLFLHEISNDYKFKDEFGEFFDERCVRWLRYIVELTDCKIVISSTWRKNGILSISDMWNKRNLPSEVIGITPLESNEKSINLYAEVDADRGYEIQEWLDNHEWDSYCIVDDDDGMLKHQNFVKIDGGMGLNKNSSISIIKYLNKII